MADYRELGEAYEDRFYQFLGDAFRPQEGPTEPPDEEDRSDLGERRGMFDGDDLLAVCRHHFWTTTVRGGSVDLAGLSAVASPPENRRRGIVADMLHESLVEYRDRDVPFSALWPFRRSFYARYGWGTCNAMSKVTVPIDDLAFAAEGESGATFRRVDADEWASLDRVYRENLGHRTLALDRTEEWWRERRFESWRTDPYVYLQERDGDTVGYLLYRVNEEDDGRVMEVEETNWVDDRAFRELLRFVYVHDSQVDSAVVYGAPDGRLRDLLDLVPDPGDVEYETMAGPMVRLVDVADALSAIPYPTDVDRSLVVSVADDLVPWNDEWFALDVAGGEGVCRPIDASDAEPDVECSINALSQLAVGYRSPRDLARVADLDADPAALAALEEVFPATDVLLGDFF